jgi:pimeloyl-ACP methyl ester carboxylesterase
MLRLFGCTALLSAILVAAASAPAGAQVAAGYQPRFEPAACPSDPPAPLPTTARCGFLVVPENRRQPAGKTIRLAVMIVPSVAQPAAPDPIVHLTGGPGGIAFFEAQELVAAGFNQRRDLILMNQRGTYYSQPALICPVIDRFNVRALGRRYDSESTRRLHVAATRSCRRQLVRRGIDIAAYNTTENAADFADLRSALGIAQWNVFGVSYGTDLARTLMRDHPEGIRSVVLDSTVPPNIVKLPGFWPNARDGFDALFRACHSQRRCSRRLPRLKQTFTRLVRRLEARPLRTTVRDPTTRARTEVVLDGGALVNWLVGMAFSTPLYKNVPSWIGELAAGKPNSIAASRAQGILAAPPGFVGYGLVYGVVCREWTPFARERGILRAGRRAFPRYPASVLAQAPQFPYMYDDCRVWDVPRAPAGFRRPVRSQIPTLLLSGDFDAVTPFAWARGAARTLPNSSIVRIPGVGHFVAPESPCAQQVMASFLTRPDAPDAGCVAALRPPTFVFP